MALFERDRELQVLTSAAADVAARGGRVILLPGESGIGKSALLRAFLDDGARPGSVWFGQCEDLVTARPMGALHEAIRSRQPVDHDLLAALHAGRVPEVMAGLRNALAAGPAAVFVVEDLHWADDATLDILGHLVRRTPELPVLFVLSYRPDALTGHERMRRFLGTMPAGTTTLRVPPLSREAVRRLAPGPDVEGLYELTGGNPFFVTEVLASGGGDLPPTVASAVVARLDSLPPRCRAALERLSVWPGSIELDLAERLVGSLEVLAEAELRGFVTITAQGLSFRHEIARRAIEATLARVRRRRMDADVIAALRDRGEADLPRLVHHALACGDTDSVVEFAPRAAAYCVRVGAHRQALSLYAATLTHGGRLAGAELARVCDDYAWELQHAHRFAEAVEFSDRALRLLERAEDRARVGPLVRAARHQFMTGEGERATEYAALAVRLATGLDARSAAQALTSLGSLRALTGHPAEAVRLLGLVDIAPDAHADLRCEVLTAQAQCRSDLSEDQRIDVLATALRAALDHEAFESAARAYTALAEVLFRFGRYARLAEVLADGLAFVREHGFWSQAYSLEAHRGLLSWRRGEVAAARAEFEMAVGRYDDPGMLSLYSTVPLARLQARLGNRSVGERLRAGWELAVRLGHLTGLGYAGAALAEWGWLYRDRGAVEDVLRGWAPHACSPTAEAFDAEIRRYAALAGVPVVAGVAEPEGAGGPASRGDSPWALALRGEHDAAAERWRAIGDPYERAIELAQSTVAADLAEASRLLDDYGALPASRWVRDRMAAVGQRPVSRMSAARSSRTRLAGLTRREADVADRVVRGLTNGEIAEELFVSVRTVDHHVSAILAKLGIDSRRAVPERLAQLRRRDATRSGPPGRQREERAALVS